MSLLNKADGFKENNFMGIPYEILGDFHLKNELGHSFATSLFSFSSLSSIARGNID